MYLSKVFTLDKTYSVNAVVDNKYTAHWNTNSLSNFVNLWLDKGLNRSIKIAHIKYFNISLNKCKYSGADCESPNKITMYKM